MVGLLLLLFFPEIAARRGLHDVKVSQVSVFEVQVSKGANFHNPGRRGGFREIAFP